MGPAEILFSYKDPGLNKTLQFRSLDLPLDRERLHDWVNRPYARKYWQLNVPMPVFVAACRMVLEGAQSHSFIGLCDDRVVCQIDCYLAEADELKDHVETGPGIAGFHILMCPPRESF